MEQKHKRVHAQVALLMEDLKRNGTIKDADKPFQYSQVCDIAKQAFVKGLLRGYTAGLKKKENYDVANES